MQCDIMQGQPMLQAVSLPDTHKACKPGTHWLIPSHQQEEKLIGGSSWLPACLGFHSLTFTWVSQNDTDLASEAFWLFLTHPAQFTQA